MAPQITAKFCDLVQTESKGLCFLAKVKMAKGKIISDEAVITMQIGDHEFSPATWVNPDFQEYFRTHMATDLKQKMSNLLQVYQNDKFQQAVLNCLSRSIPGEGLDDYAKLVFANCRNIIPQPPRVVLFGLTACAINHSCIANAGLRIYTHPDHPSMQRTQVVTNQEIEAGTEITVSYKLINGTTTERRRQLQESYGFHCVCDDCLDDTVETSEIYDKINKLLQIVEAPLEAHGKKEAPWMFFDAARELFAEYEKLGIADLRCAELFEICATVAAYHSDALRTHHFLTFADEHWKYLRPSKIREGAPIKNNPAKHRSWGHSVLGLSSMEDDELFLARTPELEFYNRVMMTGHAGSYDRIQPKEEALAEEESLARKAGDELIAEAEAEKGKQAAATPAKKSKKKKKRSKGKKGVAGGDVGGEETAEPMLAAPEVRLNAGEEGGEGELGGTGWEVVGGKKCSQQRAQEAAAAPVAKMETVPEPEPEPEMEPVAAAPVVVAAVVEEEEEEKKGRVEEEEKKERVEEEKGEEEVEDGGRAEFSVGDAAVAAEEGRLGRMRAYSQPVPFSPAAVADNDPLVLPLREDMGLFARYLRLLVAQTSQE